MTSKTQRTSHNSAEKAYAPPVGGKNLRGLTTVALLKTNFDAGKDHIEMFRPFVEDAIIASGRSEFTLEIVKEALTSKHGLDVPAATLTTLLGRCVKAGTVRKEENRYSVVALASDRVSIDSERKRIDREHHALSRQMRDFLCQNGRPEVSEDDALGMLLEFVSEHHLELLLDAPPDTGQSNGLSRQDARRVARFITDVCLKDPTLSDYLQRLLEGFVLQNTLLLKDISTAERRFRNLTVYFDSGFVFGALGLLGESVRSASREGLDLLHSVGARLAMFDKTLSEMKRILSVYERNLATAEGRSILHPTDLTRFLITSRYKPSDIRSVVSLLEKNIAALGIAIHETPRRQAQHTFDEKDLEVRLAHGRRTEMRNVHDVDCVAAVITLRAGKTSESLDDARAVFATESRFVVQTVRQWYRDSRQGGAPPVIHYLKLSNLAWLKKPASASRLKLRELVALCAAALRPSRHTWEAFLEHLRKLEREGSLTSDEAVAVVASELTDGFLAEVEDGDSPRENLAAVIDRVRDGYQKQAKEEAGRLAATAQHAVAAAEQKVHDLENSLAHERGLFRDRLSDALATIELYRERHRQFELSLCSRARGWARVLGATLFAMCAAIVTFGAIGANAAITNQLSPALGTIVRYASVLVLIVSAFALLWGGHARLWQEQVTAFAERRLRSWLFVRNGINVDAALPSDSTRRVVVRSKADR